MTNPMKVSGMSLKAQKGKVAHLIRKWIEIKWLRQNSHSGGPLPEVLFEEVDGLGACHFKRQDREAEIKGRFYSLRERSLILINPSHGDDYVINSLAHEWRHECQHRQFDRKTFIKFPKDGDYKTNCLWYYSHWWERDALLYSVKKWPDETSIEVFRWIKDS